VSRLLHDSQRYDSAIPRALLSPCLSANGAVALRIRVLVADCIVFAVLGCSDATGPGAPNATTLDGALTVASDVTCAVTANGVGYCWGSDANGQLGSSANLGPVPQPNPIDNGASLAMVSVTNTTACRLDRAGAVSCWGTAIPSLGGTSTTFSDVPLIVSSATKFTSVTSGSGFVCALDAGGSAYCWGRNAFGNLGTGDSVTRVVPTPVAGNLTFTTISAGLVDVCGIATSGAAYCWGAGDIPPLAGMSNTGPTPTRVPGSLRFSSISVGGLTACAVEAGTNAGFCWGANFDGKLGDGTQEPRAEPTPVSGNHKFASIRQSRANSTVSHTCGVTTDGSAYCWGGNTKGQVGSASTRTCVVGGSAVPCTLEPALVPSLADVTRIDAGLDHTCALTRQHEIRCWGDNSTGELGDGTTTSSAAPVLVKGGLRFP